MADIDSRLDVAASFILQSPPGEVNDVFNDVRALVGDDDALESGIIPALERYNTEQYVVADLPDKQQLLLCPSSKVPDHSNRYIEPKTSTSWSFDHLRPTASEPVEIQVDSACESYRRAFESAADSYVNEHFAEGVAKVFTEDQNRLKVAKAPKEEVEQHEGKDDAIAEPVEGTAVAQDTEMSAPTPVAGEADVAESMETDITTEEKDVPAPAPASPVAPQPEQISEPEPQPLAKKFAIYLVGNKYNPANYWTGRWRSNYALDLSSSPPTLTGQISLHVHFFEQGNVQLTTSHAPNLSLAESISADSTSPSDLAKMVMKCISKAEEEYQLELNDAYREMNEKTFRSLRRALPITRQKMDWSKVSNYKLKIGNEQGASGA